MKSAPAFEEIAETIGVRLASRLVEVYGGVSVWFPLKPHDEHPVIVALGKEDGYAVCSVLKGNTVSVPHRRARKNARADVLKLNEQGLDSREIARKLGLTQRWVLRILSEKRSPQLGLFD